MLSTTAPCPCRSSLSYGACCALMHGGQPANTPEALMRSRFTAFALNLTQYLQQSWHSSTRPAQIGPSGTTQWKNLQIFGSGSEADEGWVHFRATFREDGRWGYLEEKSRFRQELGQWRYLDGVPEMKSLHPARNEPCPCGSGLKFKKCCLVT